VSRLEPIADLASARPLWTDLAARSGNIFATWEWAETWWRHFGAGRDLELRTCLRDEEAFAILPLYRMRLGPLSLLRFVGHGPGDVLGPICAPADEAAAATALITGVREDITGWKVLLAERVPCGSGAEALGGELLREEQNPSMAISGRSWDDFVGSASKNMREKIRRSTRKVERDHELGFELCERADQVEPMMKTLFELHARRWGGDAGRFGSATVAPFHYDFAATAMERGWLRLWTMRIDGEAAAAWYGFRFGDVEAYYQSGRDPRFDRLSVGFLMLIQTIKAAFDDGMDSYGFLRGDESYKDRFATGDRALETRAIGRGAVGRTVVQGGAAATRIPAVRRRLASLVH
jgi:CelD/BcsL family acetyltransferase involved in cellulose biosynthesis